MCRIWVFNAIHAIYASNISHQIVGSWIVRPTFELTGTMDNSHYRLIFDLDKSRREKRDSRKEPFGGSMACKINFILQSMVVAISARDEKISKLCKAISSTHYNIFQINFGILVVLKGSLRECPFYLLDQKLVYNAWNCPFHK